MPDTPTPGQIAYEAFMRASLPSLAEQEAIMPWESPLFLASERAAWEAAAQAVLELARPATGNPANLTPWHITGCFPPARRGRRDRKDNDHA